MSYTPQQFLDDVKTYMVRRMGLTENEKAKLMANTVTYRPWPLQLSGRSLLKRGNILFGGTENDNSKTFIFGGQMQHDQMQLALTLAHELGHVLTTDIYDTRNHGPKWSMNVLRLGVFEPPYLIPGREHIVMPGETAMGDATIEDTALEAYVKSLPQVDWSETDAAPKP